MYMYFGSKKYFKSSFSDNSKFDLFAYPDSAVRMLDFSNVDRKKKQTITTSTPGFGKLSTVLKPSTKIWLKKIVKPVRLLGNIEYLL